MKRLKFGCMLLTDVILNQKSSTEGGNATLDFIPGNTFLGIVANHYDEYSLKEASEIFHSGRVRFGDAHPAYRDGRCAIRTLRVPASYYYPKLKSPSDICYIHHFYNRKDDEQNNGRPQQLKQCRTGFYAFNKDKGVKVEIERTFELKAAYDSALRRAKDSQMYGYESLNAGAEFFFEVEIEHDELAERIKEHLLGRHRVGRSRTAQYGIVHICEAEYQDTPSRSVTPKGDSITVYADGRLIFMDSDNEFTLQPTAKDLGIADGKIDWERSQIRTFQYAPWNGKRMTREADRLGIEKGSVFVVEKKGDEPLSSCYVGVYRNEGFGKVIYNPEFLDAKAGENGKTMIQLTEAPTKGSAIGADYPLEGTLLLDYIRRRKARQETADLVYKNVIDFASKHSRDFNGFASQWGTIRSIATRSRGNGDIYAALFAETNGYLKHGVAKDKWRKRGRIKSLEDFVKDMHQVEELYKGDSEYSDLVCKALVNLASLMAKKEEK